MDNKLKTRQYSAIVFLQSEDDLKRDRENMFSSFDSTFLRLFPNFIEDFNKLFPKQNRIKLEDKYSLTPEIPRFALIGLGISENDRIYRFLNSSVNIIYVYKDKTKRKPIVPKEECEYRFMQIKK